MRRRIETCQSSRSRRGRRTASPVTIKRLVLLRVLVAVVVVVAAIIIGYISKAW
jgi:hypothetical protein